MGCNTEHEKKWFVKSENIFMFVEIQYLLLDYTNNDQAQRQKYISYFSEIPLLILFSCNEFFSKNLFDLKNLMELN